uniref:3-hydroxyisobutyryl-CoA hydrolase n=1 Tax=Oryza nivara TaxID=4536 RepID=A0A0E0J9Q6_ORYNI
MVVTPVEEQTPPAADASTLEEAEHAAATATEGEGEHKSVMPVPDELLATTKGGVVQSNESSAKVDEPLLLLRHLSPASIEEVEAAPDANAGGEEANRPRVEGDGEGVVQSNESSAKVDEPVATENSDAAPAEASVDAVNGKIPPTKLIPQHPLEGVTLTERTVRITGNKKQIEAAKDIIKQAMSQVLVEANGVTRTLVLNRPKQLNALSSAMITCFLRCFTAYEEDDGVKLLIVKGKGRAFCAGGDVAAVVRSINNDSWKYGAHFFRNEFLLNYIIATYSKPQVSLLTGIVMGGGAGVSIHGRFRVVTDSTVFAMPETALGLFPDIGASYFLSRLPGFYGEYVGLTGVRLDAAEMLACGLATHFVPSDRLSLLEESLKKVDTSDPFAICGIIDQYSQQPSLKEKSALNRLEIINKCFSKKTVEEIIASLEQEAPNVADEWIASAIQSMRKASPTSMKISLRSIREGRTQTVGECLRREYRMVCHVMRGDFSRDFFEGCRAILLDRDRNPKWMPPRLEEVHDEVVEKYFSKVDDPEWEDLDLPPRRSHGRRLVPKL